MLKPEIKKLLVAALRSKRWRRAIGRMKKFGNYRCVLGVICEVFREQTGGGDWTAENGFLPKGCWSSSVRATYLPYAVKKWAGFTSDYGDYVKINGEWAYLVNHNDGRGGLKSKSFFQMADAIEEQL